MKLLGTCAELGREICPFLGVFRQWKRGQKLHNFTSKSTFPAENSEDRVFVVVFSTMMVP